MWWIQILIDLVGNASLFFLRAATEVGGWIWPFYLLQDPFYGLYEIFWSWRLNLFDFNDWADDVWAKVQRIWTSEGILGLIKWWFPWLYAVGEWFVDRWKWFIGVVGDWWDATKVTVLGWIDEAWGWAKELIAATEKGLVELWDAVRWFLDNLMTFGEIIQWWKDWLGKIAAALIRWGFATLFDVAGLITTAFTEREGLWSGWQDFRDKVVEFFTDPVEFIWSLFVDWFLGPEE